MADAPGDRGRLPALAVGLAVIALLMGVIGLVVVARRGGGEAPPVRPARGSELLVLQRAVSATDVLRLDRDAVEPATGSGASGLTVVDAELRTRLGLEATDVITAVAGRAVKRPFDVSDALRGAMVINARVLYVELVRAGEPVLARWELDGDLRAARAGTYATRPPAVATVDDPLLDTIKRIDDTHFELPRTTFDRLRTDPGLVRTRVRAFASSGLGVSGIRLYPLPRSFAAALGFKAGDVVRSVNGEELTSLDQLVPLATQLASASELRFELQRRGLPETLTITVTP